jgi:hypothetical protein
MQRRPMRRRELLKMAAIILGVSSATSKALAAPCASLDSADSGLRGSLHYTESGAEPSQRCAGCSFFSNPQGACGQCAIFNGPANAAGHCDSWAARS